MIVNYSIFNPTGNITALVETKVEAERQPAIADEIMKAHPRVEQVGFVYFEPGRPVPALLRMAGGEFCGNATMSAAALYAIRSGDEADSIRVRASGASHSLEVRLGKSPENDLRFETGLEMPEPVSIETMKVDFGSTSEELPVVNLGGITHIIIEQGRITYSLKDSPEAAEGVVRQWCETLGADCLGLMFLSGSDSMTKADGKVGAEHGIKADIGMQTKLVPLVYVPGADTVFWENSCASGSAAIGMYLSDKYGMALEIDMEEPAGSFKILSDPVRKITWLFGSTELVSEEQLEFAD